MATTRISGTRWRLADGWSLPLQLDDRGALSAGREDPLVDTIRLVVGVVPGERRLMPEFGCRIHELETLASERERQIAAALVEEALDRWAPRLGVERVEVLSPTDNGTVRLALRVQGAWHELDLRLRGSSRRPSTQRGRLVS